MKTKRKTNRQEKKNYWTPTKKFQLMKPTCQSQFQNNQQRRFSSTHLFIFFFKIHADFKNPIVLHIVIFNMYDTFEIVVRILTGLHSLMIAKVQQTQY